MIAPLWLLILIFCTVTCSCYCVLVSHRFSVLAVITFSFIYAEWAGRGEISLFSLPLSLSFSVSHSWKLAFLVFSPSHLSGQWHQRGALHSWGSGEYKMQVIYSFDKKKPTKPPHPPYACPFVTTDSCTAAYTPSSPASSHLRCAPPKQLFTVFTSRASKHIMSAFSWGRRAKSKKRESFFFPWQVVTFSRCSGKSIASQKRSCRQMFLLMEARCNNAPSTWYSATLFPPAAFFYCVVQNSPLSSSCKTGFFCTASVVAAVCCIFLKVVNMMCPMWCHKGCGFLSDYLL